MSEKDIEDINFEDDEKLALMPDRLSTMNSLKKTLPALNLSLEELSVFLDEKELVFSDKLKESGVELLQELSERINAIQRLNKVLETPAEEVFVSDIELCQEFVDETSLFLNKIDEFKTTNN